MTRREPTRSGDEASPTQAGDASSLVARFRADHSGATAIEYGLIAGLTFLVFVGGLKLYGTRMNVMYEFIGTSVATASS